MTRRINFCLTLLFLCCLMMPRLASGTHSMGNETNFTYLGNNRYKITFISFVDCDHGDPMAIEQDAPLYIVIFERAGGYYQFDSLKLVAQPQRIPVNSLGGCPGNSGHSCVQRSEFSNIFTLPPNKTGYKILNERCCLVGEVVNLDSSGSKGTGMYIDIPTTIVGGSPVFKSLPPVRFNINEGFEIDGSATDPDGDSLSYRLTQVYGGGTATNAKPIPSDTLLDEIHFANGYSSLKPLGNNSTLEINRETGKITGMCTKAGRYLFSIACDKYRNGKLLTTATRTFVYDFGDYLALNAGVALQAGVKAFHQYTDSIWATQCNGNNTVKFTNASFGTSSFSWDFGDPASNANTSTVRDAEHTYSGPGKYKVRLIAVGTNCSDTTYGYVIITDDNVVPDFTIDGRLCVNSTIQLTDQSSATQGTIQKYAWEYNGNIKSGSTASEIFNAPGKQTIAHYVMTAKGCIAAIEKEYDVYRVDTRTGEDTIVVKGAVLQLHATGASSYEWSPAAYGLTQLDNVALPDPVLSCYKSGGPFPFVVKGTDAQGCFETDTIRVTVTEQAYVFIPNVFTPNNDGRNDVLRPVMSGGTMELFNVYNHQGRVVFTTNNSREGWDGTYRGEPLDASTFFWMIKVKGTDGQSSVSKGDVILIR